MDVSYEKVESILTVEMPYLRIFPHQTSFLGCNDSITGQSINVSGKRILIEIYRKELSLSVDLQSYIFTDLKT